MKLWLNSCVNTLGKKPISFPMPSSKRNSILWNTVNYSGYENKYLMWWQKCKNHKNSDDATNCNKICTDN